MTHIKGNTSIEEYVKKDLFVSGENGYDTYRIPALVKTLNGTILAFCEARKNSWLDYGDIDIALRCSRDNGVSWDNMRIIADDGENTLGNPCPVVDRITGRIWLFLCGNLENGGEKLIMKGEAPRNVYIIYSDDDGLSWSKPVDITKEIKLSEWSWYATGPGHGIQLQSGRLLIPCNHAVFNVDKEESGPTYSHVIYSDNHGEKWNIGGILEELTNECCLVELGDDIVYINMRNYYKEMKRACAKSFDGGNTWGKVDLHIDLTDPMCQGNIIKYFDTESKYNLYIFSNCASTNREKISIHISKDNCHSWQKYKTLYEGPSGYSDLVITKDRKVCCLYECGKKDYYEKITLEKFKLNSLLDI